jgi:hypothetical protein
MHICKLKVTKSAACTKHKSSPKSQEYTHTVELLEADIPWQVLSRVTASIDADNGVADSRARRTSGARDVLLHGFVSGVVSNCTPRERLSC